MRFFALFFITAILSCYLPGSHAKASHETAAAITYKHLQGLQYEVTVQVLNGCHAHTFVDREIEIRDGASNGCNARPILVRLPKVSGIPIQNYCKSVAMSGCYYLELYTRHLSTYRGIVTLPHRSTKWVFSFHGPQREVSANVFELAQYTSSSLNNSVVDNSSPTYNARYNMLLNAIEGKNLTATFGGYDSDGDSVVYEPIMPMYHCLGKMTGKPAVFKNVPQSVPGCTILYPPNNVYSAAFPLPAFKSTYHVFQLGNSCQLFPLADSKFDSTKGTYRFRLTHFKPNAAGSGDNNYLLAVMANEYRRVNGTMTLIGSSVREAVVVGYSPSINVDVNPFDFRGGRYVIDTIKGHVSIRASRNGQNRIEVDFKGSRLNDSIVVSMDSDSLSTDVPPHLLNRITGIQQVRQMNGVQTLIVDIDPLNPDTSAIELMVYTNTNACPLKFRKAFLLRILPSGSIVQVRSKWAAPSISLHPNPATGQVQLEGAAGLTYHISNALGQKQLTGLVSSDIEFVNIKDLKTGLHFVTLSNGKQLKFVKE